MTSAVRTSPTGSGSLFALAAFTAWGAMPLYFRALGDTPALDVLAHRVLGSALLLGAAVLALRRGPALLAALRLPSVRRALLLSSALIAANWLIFIWAIQTQRVLQASLGYFINPLLNVALGFALLGERLRRLQAAAVLLAAASVTQVAVRLGQPPWIALSLAITFALYGLVRKLAAVDPLGGLLVECAVLSPPGLLWLAGRLAETGSVFGQAGGARVGLLLLAGPVTAVPLLLFTAGARRLTLTALGFFQYLAPTGQFLIGAALWREPFPPALLHGFLGIWIALALVSADALVARRGRRQRPGPVPPAAASGTALPPIETP